MKILEDIHLHRMREEWRATIEDKGGHCPCCGRWGRVYKRPLNETMARSLIWLCDSSVEDAWVDVPATAPRWLVQSNQLPTLRWWGLVVRCNDNVSEDKKHSGMWKPTELGRLFRSGKSAVQKYVYTYNGAFEKFGGPDVLISDCFGDSFSYKEIMSEYE